MTKYQFPAITARLMALYGYYAPIHLAQISTPIVSVAAFTVGDRASARSIFDDWIQ